MKRLLSAVALLLSLGIHTSGQFAFNVGSAKDDALPELPSGFKISVFAKEPMVRNVCALVFDSKGRLFVSQGPQYRHPKPETPGDWITILSDRDHDGVADEAKTFASGFNSIQALAWKGNDLWVANAPDLTVVRDLDGDDEADEYVPVYSGLGTLEHALHGLNWAPDGKLYMSKGDTPAQSYAPKAFRELMQIESNAAEYPPIQIFKKGEYRKTYEVPMDGHTEGGILRCDDMGRNLEIFCRGLRNPWDITFDDEFNWMGTDQDDSSEADRVVMPFFGAHFGHHHRWSNSWTGKDHPQTTPASGFFPRGDGSGVGIVYYTHDQFPRSYWNTFLIGDWLLMSIYQFVPNWNGALIEWKDGMLRTFAKPGGQLPLFRPTDLEVGPDGALYAGGWGKGYGVRWKDGQMANEGRVFRIWYGESSPRLPTTWQRANRQKPIETWPVEELIDELKPPIRACHVDAQNELVRRGLRVKDELLQKLASGPLTTRQQTWIAWTLGRMGIDASLDRWFAHQSSRLDADPNLRVQAIRILGHRIRYGLSTGQLAADFADLLKHSEPRIRFEAVQTVWQAGQKQFRHALKDRTVIEYDQLTSYALWRALQELQSIDQRKQMLKDARPQVRLAGLLGLLESNDLAGDDVLEVSQDNDPRVQQVASQWLARVGHGVNDKDKVLALLYQHDHRAVNSELRMNLLHSLARFRLTDKDWPTFHERFYRRWRGRDDEVYPEQKAKEIALALEIMSSNIKALPILWDALNHDWEPVREAAVRSFARLEDAGLDYLMTNLPKGEQMRQQRAIEALWYFNFSTKPWQPRPGIIELIARSFDESKSSLTRGKLVKLLAAVDAAYWKAATASADRTVAIRVAETAAKDPDPRVMREVVSLAAKLETKIEIVAAERQVTIDEIMPLVNRADPKRGETIFFDAKASCAVCHQVRGRGRAFGPDLSAIGGRADARQIIESILDPNANVIEGYRVSVITLNDGEQLEGMIHGETGNSLKLFQADGIEKTLAKRSIAKRENRPDSLMPSILGQVLEKQELADLTAWLLQQK